MRQFYYYINVLVKGYFWNHPYAWIGQVCRKYGDLDMHRAHTRQAGYKLPNCGNHLAYLGGYEKVLYKIQNYSHADLFATPQLEIDLKNKIKNLESINPIGAMGGFDKNGNGLSMDFNPKKVIIDIDELHPKTIRENIKDWTKYIRNKEM